METTIATLTRTKLAKRLTYKIRERRSISQLPYLI